ncbi:hypothetical protein [Phytohalomonas tamaricis]|uniref:hypothetical protein n=1 Tax=Phytohalomonas tamaricis TaxID=2081032 RepID=UPI00131A10CD|nr:hypothetical protein [Phytohalomonas tamaricis]
MFRSNHTVQHTTLTPLLLIDQQAMSEKDTGEIIFAKGASLGEYRHCERHAEWRLRQAYFARHGYAPGPTIFKI